MPICNFEEEIGGKSMVCGRPAPYVEKRTGYYRCTEHGPAMGEPCELRGYSRIAPVVVPQAQYRAPHVAMALVNSMLEQLSAFEAMPALGSESKHNAILAQAAADVLGRICRQLAEHELSAVQRASARQLADKLWDLYDATGGTRAES